MKTTITGVLATCLLVSSTAFATLNSANGPVAPRGSGASWSWANPTPQGNSLNAVLSGSSLNVAVGGGGTIFTGGTSGTWTAQVSGTTNNLYAITYGNGYYVAVGQADTILYSTDGITWNTATVTDVTQNLFAVTYGNGIYVAAGSNGILFTSTNGTSWTQGTLPSGAGVVTGLAYGAGEFVAVTHLPNGATVIFYSTTGASSSWTAVNVATTDPSIYVAYNGSQFTAIGLNLKGTSGGSVITSTDGISWTMQSPLTATSFPIAITTNGTNFVVMLQSGAVGSSVTTPIDIETSSDGTSWTSAGTNNLPATWSQNISRSLSCDATTCVTAGAGAYIATSSNLTSWTSRAPIQSLTYEHLRGVHWFNGQFFAVGDNDTILTSTNGSSWAKQAVSVANPSNLRDIAYGNGRYVIVGSNGVVLTSSDGTTWSSSVISSATSYLFEGLTWNGGLFVAVGTGGAIYTSPDGLTWTVQQSGTTSNLWNVAWTGTNFVAVTDSSQDSTRVVISPDGVHWSAVPFNQNYPTSLYGIQWSGTELIASGGAINPANPSAPPVAIIATSTDGSTWTIDYSNLNDTFSDAIQNGTEFLAVTQSSGSVYTSTDGTTWVLQNPTFQDDGLQNLAKYGEMVTATGYAGIILYVNSQPPTCDNGSVTTTENTAVNGTLQSTGGTLTYALASQPSHGTVQLTNTATGAFTYTPASGFSGSDSFTFTASNTAGTSNVATEAITVTPIPAPSAQNGSVSTTENTPVNGTLQATGSITSFQIVNQPVHGTLSLTNVATGAFTYTPNSGFSGTDSFTFTASNGGGTSNTATETVTIKSSTSGGSGNGSSGGGGGGGLGLMGLLILIALGIRRCWARRTPVGATYT